MNICIYIYICLSARALHKTVHILCKSYHIGSCAVSFRTADQITTLRSRPSLGMANGASSAEDSPDDDSNLSRTHTATGSAAQARVRHRERNDWQLNDFGIFLSLLLLHIIHVPCHVHHLAYCKYIHTFRVSLLCCFSSFKFINCCMVEVRGVCLHIAYA